MKSEGTVSSAPSALGLLYHWMKVWPDAKLDRAVVASLYPYIVEKWREGWSLLQIAQTACSMRRRQEHQRQPAAIKAPGPADDLAACGGQTRLAVWWGWIRDVETVAKLKQKIEGVGYEVESIGSLLKAAYLAVKTAPPATRDRAERNRPAASRKARSQRKIVEEAQKRLADMEPGVAHPRQSVSRR